jgi:hypothetical protein
VVDGDVNSAGTEKRSVKWMEPAESTWKQKVPKLISSPLPKEKKAGRMAGKCGMKDTDRKQVDSS